METWQGPPKDACSIHVDGTDFRSYISSVNDNRSWACALPLPGIELQQWDASQRDLLAPLHPHNRRLEEHGLDFSRPRVLSMPEYETTIRHDACEQPERLPQIITGIGRHRSDPRLSSETIFDHPAGKYYTTSSNINVDNVSQLSDLSPRPLMEYESNASRSGTNVYPKPPPTRHRYRSRSVAETSKLSPPRDRKYLFVNRTVKDGKLISRGVQASGSWKTIDRRKKAARDDERRVAKATTEAISNLRDHLGKMMGMGLSFSDLMEELGREAQKTQVSS
ncbi:hypothetical protein CaCOL14_012194 [Colletotrichum acutatum]|uniref:Developmental regulatory protein wetA n=1 Tax=Glomerella acutata TaxID=27357 RepID=A0AAD8USU5_GLOAC|nr:uncharacterized protein BDZ83DRAFT_616024 [Colletotrichum acutatum]KAK1726489.1 hypothetical protein BDZ83DRAFT_616024 [Colletotrichum acutatum]